MSFFLFRKSNWIYRETLLSFQWAFSINASAIYSTSSVGHLKSMTSSFWSQARAPHFSFKSWLDSHKRFWNCTYGHFYHASKWVSQSRLEAQTLTMVLLLLDGKGPRGQVEKIASVGQAVPGEGPHTARARGGRGGEWADVADTFSPCYGLKCTPPPLNIHHQIYVFKS